MKVKIRKATLKDVPVIVRMWKEFMGYHKDMVKRNPKIKPYLTEKKNSSHFFTKYLKSDFKSSNSVVFIAEVEGRPVGYSINLIRKNPLVYEVEKLGYVSDLFVKKEFRGMKISSMFRDESIKWFRKKGIKHMSVEVIGGNTYAHSIYKKWGFFDYKVEMRKKI